MSPSYSHTFASTNVDRMVPFSFKNDAPAEGIVEAMEQAAPHTQDELGYNHWNLHSMGQEECYHVAEVIQDEFQGVQGQMAWLASRSKETSDHLAHMEWELKSLWVAFQLEQKYLHHLIKEHLMPLQSPYPNTCCQCPILGDFIASPIPASFRGLHSEVSFRHGSPPPLKSCSTPDSFISFWEELNAIVGSEVSPIKQEGLLLHEVEVADEEASEEVWEEIGSGGSGGSGVGGGEVS